MAKNPVRTWRCWSRAASREKRHRRGTLPAGPGAWAEGLHSLERPWSRQVPKLVLVMEPTMDLSASQVRPRSQGHL